MDISKTLTDGVPWKKILLFALPIMAANLLQQLYNTVDTIILGNFESQAALSAVGSCAFLTNLYLAIALGFSMGANVVAAQLYGAQDIKKLKKCFSTSIILLLGMGMICTIFSLGTNQFWLVHIIGVPESLYNMAYSYMSIYALGLIFQFMYNIIASLLKALGDSRASLIFLLVASVVNIVLDIIFIAVMHMGVIGAALATNIAQMFSLVASLLYLNKCYPQYRIHFKNKFDHMMARHILKTGLPMTIQQVIVSCGFMFMQRLVNSFGESMTASFTVAMRLEYYLFVPTTALQNAMATYAGQNYGAGKIDRIKQGVKQTVIMATAIAICLGIITFIFHKQMIQIFGIHATSLKFCIQHMRTASFAIILFASYFPCLGLYQGVGKGFFATLVATVVLVSRIIFAYSLVPFIDYHALWWCEIFGYILAIIINYAYYYRERWLK